jgi:hypothetical protein
LVVGGFGASTLPGVVDAFAVGSSGAHRLPAPVDAVLVGSKGGASGCGGGNLIVAGGNGAGLATVLGTGFGSVGFARAAGSQKPDVVVQVRPSSPVQVVVLPTVVQVPP